jgi:hypothetical protein
MVEEVIKNARLLSNGRKMLTQLLLQKLCSPIGSDSLQKVTRHNTYCTTALMLCLTTQ